MTCKRLVMVEYYDQDASQKGAYTAKADCLNPSHVDKMPLYRAK